MAGKPGLLTDQAVDAFETELIQAFRRATRTRRLVHRWGHGKRSSRRCPRCRFDGGRRSTQMPRRLGHSDPLVTGAAFERFPHISRT